MNTEEVTLLFDIDCPEPSIANSVDFNYLLVRYGNNEQIEQKIRDKDDERKLRNVSKPVNQVFDSGKIHIKATIKIHPKLGTEFKLFVDVAEEDLIQEVQQMLTETEFIKDTTPSLNRHRIFILLDDIYTTVSPEGFRNNFLPSSLGADKIRIDRA